MTSSAQTSLRELAKKWISSGLSVVPIRPDGTKAPAIDTWTELQKKALSDSEIDQCFKPGIGIGILGGRVSGNLEILDFDVPDEGGCAFDEWMDQLDDELLSLVESMPLVQTPGGGRHIYYRCESIASNKKLAMLQRPDDWRERADRGEEIKLTIIETRGEGGYVLAPGCSPECHPTGRTYDLLHGDIESIPTLTKAQREKILAVCQSFDRSGILEEEQKRKSKTFAQSDREGKRPGDDYNRRASWEDILEAEGWTFTAHRRHDGAQLWKRPGKTDKGISATIREFDGEEIFHCFSSNNGVFPFNQSITKFTAYTLIHHDGDYEAAARELGKQGYGEAPKRRFDIESAINAQRDDDVPWTSSAPSGTQARVDEMPDDWDGDDAPDVPFIEDAPSEASFWHEEVDPLEAQISANDNRTKRATAKRKQKEQEYELEEDRKKGSAYIVWRDFGFPPRRELTDDGRIKTRVEKPRDTAWHILKDCFCHSDDLRKIHYQHSEFMQWNGERYRRLKMDDIRPQLSNYMTHFAEFDGLDKEENPIYKPFKVRSVRVDEIVKTVKDLTHIDSEILDPCWLSDGDDLPDPREVVCCKNGLLDIANNEFIESTPAFYSFNNTGIVYDPSASKPENWIRFLESTLDQESRDLLQEWFGYCLVQDTRLQKMLMVVGKPGSGKGTAMSILQELVGESSVCSMDFDRMGNNFALSIALGKSLMLFPDARQGFKLDSKGTVVGNILSITGEDALMIDRKNMKPVTQKLNTRIVIVSNEVINLSDSSGALNRRMLWVKFPGFEQKEDPDLKSKLHDELSGILNWAIQGWIKVRSTGKFTQPSSSKDFMETFQEQASPVKKFLDDMCSIDKDFEQKTSEFFIIWNIWRKVQGYKTTSNAAFGKMLISADMRISKSRKRVDGVRTNFYSCIKLDPEKVDEFIKGSVGQEKWDKAKEDFLKNIDGDIIDIFEYLEKNKE